LSKLQKLRDAKTLDDFAPLLGFTPSGLSYVLFKIPESAKYTEFEIPKRSGGKRQIKAPQPMLGLLQRRLARLLYECLEELTKAKPPRRSLAHGFEKNRSIITNAALHKCRRYVLNLDLQDFFPSINFGRIRGFFIKDKHFALQEKVATVIAQIACHDNQLPQGSPCSPVISNLVGHLLDARLARFAKIHKCTYSRYADDITFSTSKKQFPPELALPGSAGWELGTALRIKIEHSGFKINDSKTRMQLRGSRQVTTGLMVNENVNIRPEYWRKIRHMSHALFKTGSYFRMVPTTLAGGAAGGAPVKDVITTPYSLDGALAHIHQVKSRPDQRKKGSKSDQSTAARRLYFQFLFYKHFVALDRPLIVPEGITDSVYLRTAAHHLPAYHPRLGLINNGKFVSAIRYMNYTKTVHEILLLGNGAGAFKTFLSNYHKHVESYGHAPLAFPVIVLVDNDDGGGELFPCAKSKGASTISFKSTDPFYHLGLNLYLIKTLEKNTAPHKSCIEDLFEPALLNTLLDGKTLDLSKAHNAPGKYGKVAFADRVVLPNANTIDFSGFARLLNRIIAVLDHHAAHKDVPLAAAV
jgi:retron-type reverse transcriptase